MPNAAQRLEAAGFAADDLIRLAGAATRHVTPRFRNDAHAAYLLGAVEAAVKVDPRRPRHERRGFIQRGGRWASWGQRARDARHARVRSLTAPWPNGDPRAEPADPHAPDPAAVATRAELRQIVRSALAKLAPTHRRALLRHALDGHSYADLGRELGVAADVAARIVRTAASRLRQLLERRHPQLRRSL